MKKIRLIILFSFSLLLGAAAYSQQGTWKLNANYSAAFPTGNLKNMFSDPSYRGWSGAILYGATDKLQVGLEAGFQDFYQKTDRAVYHEGGSDVSAVISHSVQTIPLMVKGKYMFTNEGFVRPFASLAVGGNLVQYRKFYGQFSESDTKFGFAAQPELGIHIPVGKTGNTGLHIAAGYNLMPYKFGDADGLNSAVLKAGISFPLR
jgi:hypothetical protein